MFCVSDLKAFNAADDVKFKLYRRSLKYTELHTKKSLPQKFDPRIPTRVFIHGTQGDDAISKYCNVMKTLDDTNFIVVDWRQGSRATHYFSLNSWDSDVSYFSVHQ